MIPKAELVDGAVYIGECRNATEARWDAKRGVFVYLRRKWGQVYEEEIYHPDDDDQYDTFIPERMKP